MLQKDYTELDNKPQINGVTLSGNKTAADLSIDIPIATTSAAGKVKPDGTTITVDSDGTIHGANTVPICDSSDAWSAKSYAVGNTVIDDNKVYECIVVPANVNLRPSQDSSHTYWKQITLSSLNSSFKPILLWKNPNASSENLPNFVAQTINVDFSDYEAIEIVYCNGGKYNMGTRKVYLYEDAFDKVLYITWSNVNNQDGYYWTISRRNVTIKNNQLVFEDNYYGRSGAAASVQNAYIIPYAIYGIK